MEKIEFKEKKIVPLAAIDGLGHVNNIVYLEWVQEVSQKHWEAQVEDTVRKELLWVVLSHYIEYLNPCFEGEEVELTTWVKTMKGVRSTRCVGIRRLKDDKPIAKTETVWCLIDAKTKRPKRITPELSGIFVSE